MPDTDKIRVAMPPDEAKVFIAVLGRLKDVHYADASKRTDRISWVERLNLQMSDVRLALNHPSPFELRRELTTLAAVTFRALTFLDKEETPEL